MHQMLSVLNWGLQEAYQLSVSETQDHMNSNSGPSSWLSFKGTSSKTPQGKFQLGLPLLCLLALLNFLQWGLYVSFTLLNSYQLHSPLAYLPNPISPTGYLTSIFKAAEGH